MCVENNQDRAAAESVFQRLLIALAVFFSLNAGGIALAAPDIEIAPRLTGEDFGPEQFPYDHAIAIPSGEASFYPSGAIRLDSIDNLYFTESGEESDVRISIQPKIDWVAEGAKQTLWGLYRGDYRLHTDFDNADTTEHRLRGLAHFDFTSRQRLDLELSYLQLGEELGTGRTAAIEDFSEVSDSDSYSLMRLGATFSYGNPRARGEWVSGIAWGTLAYLSNEEVLDYLDRDITLLWSRLSYALTPKTRLFARLGYRDQQFANPEKWAYDPDRNSLTTTLGARWASGGLWYGDVAVAQEDVSFSSSANDRDYAAVDYFANLYWDLKTYSTLAVYARQYERENVGDSAPEVERSLGFNWRHAWSERFSTRIGANESVNEFRDGFETSQNEYAAEGRLSLRRWLNLLFGASSTSQDVDRDAADRTTVYIGLEGNL